MDERLPTTTYCQINKALIDLTSAIPDNNAMSRTLAAPSSCGRGRLAPSPRAHVLPFPQSHVGLGRAVARQKNKAFASQPLVELRPVLNRSVVAYKMSAEYTPARQKPSNGTARIRA